MNRPQYPLHTSVHIDATIHPSVELEDFVLIGNEVILEEDVYVSSGVKIYGRAHIHKGCFIGENCIIGHPQRDELNKLLNSKENRSSHLNDLVEIGSKCCIRANSIIYSSVNIGSNCQTGHGAMIREKTIIGANTLIGTNVVIDGQVNIGHHVSIQTGVYIPLHCQIGNHVFMGPFSKLTNDKYVMRKKCLLEGPTLEDYVSLGANAVILPGVCLKKGTIVGASAVVTHDTAEDDIIYGIPARKRKTKPKEWAESLKKDE